MEARELYPDTVAFNSNFHTMGKNLRTARAVAIKDGRFVAVGEDEEVRRLAGPGTELLDLGNRTVIPGIIDSHNHLLEVGTKLAMIRLDECRSPAEMMELVRERAKVTPPGEWIIGMGWNDEKFEGHALPTRHDIDPATSGHPVVLMRFFNIYVVNTYALKLAGIDSNTPNPAGGKIEREADGTPNGLLRASAKQPIRDLIPQPTTAQIKERIKLSCSAMHRFGITSVIEPGLYPWEIRAYQASYRDGDLSVRANLMPSWHGFHDEEGETLGYRAGELGIYSGFGDEWLSIGALKMAIDGGTTPHTAYMYEPFIGESGVINYNRLDGGELRKYFTEAQELGWDVGIHCCGDRAQDMAVEAFAEIAQQVPRPDARHSVIHAYFPTEKSLGLMSEYGIAAVIQPTFIYYEGDSLFRDVGEERAHRYKPARSYLDRGIVVTSSSDVESTVSANPFPALYSLVTRKNGEGTEIAPGEKITREEALHTYTAAGAWLSREENLKGTIEVGKLADMAVLDRNYFQVPEEEIRNIRVEMTFINGKCVFSTAT